MSVQCEIAPFGECSVLITSDQSLLGYVDGLKQFGRVRLGMTSVLIEGVEPGGAIAAIEAWLATAKASEGVLQAQSHLINVRYDGADLESVARLLGISPEEVVRAHTSLEWKVAMLGFSPGFGYLITDHANPFDRLPRLATPRTRVPQGSVAVAAGMSAIYPSPSPGGWNLIGTSDVVLFNVESNSPSLLSPGDTVRFVAND